LNGVVDAGVFFRAQTVSEAGALSIAAVPEVDLGGQAAGTGLTVYGAEPGTLAAAKAQFASGHGFDELHIVGRWNVAVLGAGAATRLGVSTMTTLPTVFVGNNAYAVIGVLAHSGSLPELGNAVILPASTALDVYGPPSASAPARLLARTELGAAELIAVQAPLALAPGSPGSLVSDPVPDWSKLTDPVNTSMNSLMLGLAAVALVIGCVAIANTTLTSVMERSGEIGLRQAMGARPIHIAAQFISESAIQGGMGGLIGGAVGVAAVLLVCVAQHWTPYFDWRLVVASPAVGALIGIAAGLYPARKASRVPPAHALQHL
jgi:putative ABC transport system permease protein